MTNDLISREAAISLLKDQFYEQCPKGSVQRILFANAIEALTNMPSAESGWRPIETAPKDGPPVLLFARCQHATASGIVVGWHLEDRGWIELSFTSPVGIVPSHWMPLPEFPA